MSLSNWLLCIDKALAKCGYTRSDVDYLATLLVKRSAHDYLMKELGLKPEQTRYLEEFGHHGQNDQILSLELAVEENRLKDGDLVLMISGGDRICLECGGYALGRNKKKKGNRRMIYGDWIGRWGRAYPDKEALVDAIEGRRYTYGELSAEINRMASFLSGGTGD